LIQKVLVVEEELLTVLRREIHFARDQKAVAINQTTGFHRLFGHHY
jgi:hypothetical protein